MTKEDFKEVIDYYFEKLEADRRKGYVYFKTPTEPIFKDGIPPVTCDSLPNTQYTNAQS